MQKRQCQLGSAFANLHGVELAAQSRITKNGLVEWAAFERIAAGIRRRSARPAGALSCNGWGEGFLYFGAFRIRAHQSNMHGRYRAGTRNIAPALGLFFCAEAHLPPSVVIAGAASEYVRARPESTWTIPLSRASPGLDWGAFRRAPRSCHGSFRPGGDKEPSFPTGLPRSPTGPRQ